MSGIFHSLKKASPKPQIELDFLIRFFDYDGTLLKEQWVEYGGASATAPELPTHDNLTFHAWNKDYTKTNKNLDVGAVYSAAHTYIYITLNLASTNRVRLKVVKTDTSLMTVYWGDGTSSTKSDSGNIEFAYNYPNYGDYVIRIETTGNFYLGQGGSTTPVLDTLTPCITKVLLCDKAVLTSYCFDNAKSLRFISLGKFITSIPLYCFNGCALVHVTLPEATTSISVGGFTGNYALKSVSLPETMMTISTSAFYFTLSLESIIFPWKVNVVAQTVLGQSMVKKVEFQGQVSQIQTSSFTSMNAIEEFIFKSTTPPTLVAGAFTIENMFLVKIYVPDASVAAYKAATNWVNLANFIYPLSSRP